MPQVTIIIPTFARPELLWRATESVLNQSFQDFEIIIVDDCREQSVENIAASFKESRIRYIRHEKNQGGAAARNTGIKNARGEFIAFLDDDDEWLPNKLKAQMKEFEKTGDEVGFCFTAIEGVNEIKSETSDIPDGVADYYELALKRFKGFLTSSLIVKKKVFEDVGYFDEKFPSHQEADLIIRIAKKYKGLGINEPLVRMNMMNHEQIGTSLSRRIAGREMILQKYFDEYMKYPEIMAKHYFWLAIMYRDNKEKTKAKENFKKAWQTKFNVRFFFHYLIA
ncbi:MAG: hypothetical protein A2174_02340 [Candidatus Portnoybacteria bacterium RBG_13_41_18]|uniref:Glycosyltransferase 2-like domain-containing protein n=1 Tax=Candidatus Portnoybacteria bacterium RBG_13_41_18 TaxID=1801991 RepID=A0A1G2FAU3_9BACT|nr:MAG: hypothetical protein A2174_02340 [Candidatus Portnoybacteria bacterium RBG_13_41_18]